MKQTKVTDIAIKPTAEKILASMQAQLDNPKTKQKWDSPFKRRTGIGKNALTIIRNEKRSLFQTHLLSDLEDSNFLNIIKLKKPLKKNKYIPREHQKEVIKRGKGAFASAGSRSSVISPTQWGVARLYAFYFKSISGKLDFDKDLAKNINFKK